MNRAALTAGAVVALVALAVPTWAWAKSRKRAGGDPEVESVAAMAVVENGVRASSKAHQLVAEAFWRNTRASERTPRQILAGKGGPLAPWPTASTYRALLARARVDMLARPEDAARVVRAVKAAKSSQQAPEATNWTHGKAPYQPWLEKGYVVVASAKVPSETRPYLWVYRRPT
jgi:hypothetical protein